MKCHACPLAKSRKNIVKEEWNGKTRLMAVGEAPGKAEDLTGNPFVGKAGKEYDNYLQLFTKIPRPKWYTSNVLKCRPPRNRDPLPKEIEACGKHLWNEVHLIRPKFIIAMGRTACEFFGITQSLDVVHGIPQPAEFDGLRTVVIPIYHPAWGLYETPKMIFLQRDFENVGKIVRGEISADDWKDEHPDPEYKESSFGAFTFPGEVTTVDTEARYDGSTWSVQFSNDPGSGLLVRPDGKYMVTSKDLVVHNALYDIPHMGSVNFDGNIKDTMVMAYLLQDEPQSLKALAYRHAGMEMLTYKEVIRDAQRKKSIQYLNTILSQEWPEPEPVLVWDKDKPRAKKPWPIHRKANRIKHDVTGKGADPWDRWHGIPLNEGRQVVEDRLGTMPVADLSDVPRLEAVNYACRDADATLRVYPALWSRIKYYDLEETFWMDMAITEMVIDMMKFGMPISVKRFERLASKFQKKMDELEEDIQRVAGRYLNVCSDTQIRKLLFGDLKLKKRGKTPKGQPSTNQKVLEQLKDDHPVVQKILDHRKYEKLQTTYAIPLPAMSTDSRIHPQILTTRTNTGRLASKSPNLQNIPVRSEDGRRIRDCFESLAGCDLLSADYSQIELRILAHESDEPTMVDVFMKGEDIHARTASEIFGIPQDQLDDYDHRRPAKTVNFGVVYGISPGGLVDSLAVGGNSKWDEERCAEFIGEWFKIYPGVKHYMKLQETHARRHGYVKDMWGRMRRIPEVKSAHKYIRQTGVRMAGNMGIQSGAQGVIKKAMAELTPYYKKVLGEGRITRPLIQIHDDLVWEVEEGMVMVWFYFIKNIMESVVNLRVPVLVDGKRGKRWGSMKSI
jgi:uracil-DNA glycosylase family 4